MHETGDILLQAGDQGDHHLRETVATPETLNGVEHLRHGLICNFPRVVAKLIQKVHVISLLEVDVITGRSVALGRGLVNRPGLPSTPHR
jgi:hypothetical protein